MSIRNDFYNYDFSNFIELNKPFFKKYQSKFVKTFQEYLTRLSNKHFNFEKEIESFYKRLFISPFMNNHIISIKDELSLIFKLKRYNIDVELILNRLFLLMSNNYIKYILKEKNSINKLKTFAFLCNFYLEYMNYHLNNIEEDFETYILPEEIYELYNSKTHLNLFSIYKGIPIAHKTQILNINDEDATIEVSANKYQIVAAKFHKEIFLLENDKEYSYRATITHIRPYKKHLVLKNIEKKQRNAPKRNFIRVQPKEQITVNITKHNKIITAKIYDISLRGMCIVSEKKLSLEVSDYIKIEFNLQLEKIHLIKTSGEIKSITKIDNNTYKYHIQFKTEPSYEFILEKYITKREKEIIKELNSYIEKEFISLIE